MDGSIFEQCGVSLLYGIILSMPGYIKQHRSMA